MARKRASLEGRGSEILIGVQPEDEQAEIEAASEPSSSSGADEAQSPALPVQGSGSPSAELDEEPPKQSDGAQDLSPEWADLLQEEALSSAGSETPATDLDLVLPPLATTPARPNKPVGESPESAASIGDETTEDAAVSAPAPVVQPGETIEDAEDAESEAGLGVEDAVDPVEGMGELADAGEAELSAELAHEPPAGAPPAGAQPESYPAAQGPTPAAPPSISFVEPTPPAPMYTESSASGDGDGAYVPAPKEKPEATDRVMRTKLDGLLYQQATVKPSEADLEPEGPKAPEMVIEELEEYEVGQPSRARREPEILAYVGREERNALWNETLELYRLVPDVLGGDANQGRALRLLQEAQDILLEKPRQFDVAKFKVGQVQTLVSWRRNVNRWSNTYGWGIFIYQMVWIVALMLGVFGAEIIVGSITSMAGGAPGIEGLSRLWSTMMWGGLGGVIGAFYSLYWHVAKVRDFDKQYTMWYIVQPVIGALLGALVHLLIGSGFLTAQGVNEQDQAVAVSLFPYAVATIAGFRQRFILEMIDRVIQVITPSPPSHESSVEESIDEEPLNLQSNALAGE